MPLCAHHVVVCIVSWAFSPPLLWCLHPSHSLRSSPPVHTWETQVKSGHLQVRTLIRIKWSERMIVGIISGLFCLTCSSIASPRLCDSSGWEGGIRRLELWFWLSEWSDKRLKYMIPFNYFFHFRNAGGLIMAPLCPLGWGYKRRGEHSNVHFV